MLLDGKKIAQDIYTDLEHQINSETNKPVLWAILVWDNDSPSLRYIRQKERNAEKVGMGFHLVHLPKETTEEQLLQEVIQLNTASHISGYIIQLPLPQHISTQKIIDAIDPSKDVDGFHPFNQWKILTWDTSGFIPCTPAGIMHILSHMNVSLNGKTAVVLWRSNIVGKPMVNLLINAWATVINCNSQTPDISVYTKKADIIISAVGKSRLITTDIVKPESVIIDVGFSLIDGEIFWDTDYMALHQNGHSVTPVPGWVGPMTVAMLLKNTLIAHKKRSWTFQK